MIAVEGIVLSDSVAIYLRRYGDQCMREIDAYVVGVAVRPLNSDELLLRKKSVMASTQLSADKIRDIVKARHASGVYNALLEELHPNLAVTSVPRNLRNIGIAV